MLEIGTSEELGVVERGLMEVFCENCSTVDMVPDPGMCPNCMSAASVCRLRYKRKQYRQVRVARYKCRMQARRGANRLEYDNETLEEVLWM